MENYPECKELKYMAVDKTLSIELSPVRKVTLARA